MEGFDEWRKHKDVILEERDDRMNRLYIVVDQKIARAIPLLPMTAISHGGVGGVLIHLIASSKDLVHGTTRHTYYLIAPNRSSQLVLGSY